MRKMLGVGLAGIFSLGMTSFGYAAQCGAITKVEGEAQIVRSGQTMPAVIGTPVERGDLIRAPKGTSVDFSVDGVAGLSVSEGTECEIAQAGEGMIKVDLSLGELRANIKTMPMGGSFTVETPTAIAAVRGTQFMSRVIMNEQNMPDSSFAVRDSFVDVTAKISGEKFSVGQGQAIDIPSIPENGGLGVRSASNNEVIQMEGASQITACA